VPIASSVPMTTKRMALGPARSFRSRASNARGERKPRSPSTAARITSCSSASRNGAMTTK